MKMKFKVKDMDIGTGGASVVTLNYKDARELDVHPMDRVLVKKGRKSTVAVLDIAESKRAVPQGKIGLFEEVLHALNVKEGDFVEAIIQKKPVSVSYIRKKLDGKMLSYNETYEIVKDIVNDKLTDIELTSYVSANYTRGMSMKEIVHLTNAMTATGTVLKLNSRPVVDLHSIGGVPGNRTTLIVVPLLAAAGLIVPKTSSRAITSPAGTADTMEVLCKVAFPLGRLHSIIKKTGAFIIWGGAVNLAPADDKIIRVEHPLSIDAEGQMLASIMAKKSSVSATHLLMDIPIGEGSKVGLGSKVKNRKKALHLKKQFEKLSKKLKIKIKFMITDGSQPVGNGIGPALEARDCIWILQKNKNGPEDLKLKSLRMAEEILEFAGKAEKGKGLEMAERLLENGSAYKKFQEMVLAQEGRKINAGRIPLGKYAKGIISSKKGIVKSIDNITISKIARTAGAPTDLGAGVYLFKHKKDIVVKGDKLFIIYSESKRKLDYAVEIARNLRVFEIG